MTVLDEIIPPSLPDIPKSTIDLVHPQMAYLGQNLTVEVVIETETSLAGWSFDVSYDPKILSFQVATIRDFLGVDIDKMDFYDVGEGAICETMARDIVLHKMACGMGEGNTERKRGDVATYCTKASAAQKMLDGGLRSMHSSCTEFEMH